MEKEELLKEIEKLLSFDGKETLIHPDYLHYFSVEQLEQIRAELVQKQSNMVDEHREWMLRFTRSVEPSGG